MKYERRMQPSNAVEYMVSGEFTIFFLNQIKTDIEKDIQTHNVSYFIFDFTKVTYIDSASIGLLIIAGKYNDKNGNKLFIRNAGDNIRHSIEIADIPFIEYI